MDRSPEPLHPSTAARHLPTGYLSWVWRTPAGFFLWLPGTTLLLSMPEPCKRLQCRSQSRDLGQMQIQGTDEESVYPQVLVKRWALISDAISTLQCVPVSPVTTEPNQDSMNGEHQNAARPKH